MPPQIKQDLNRSGMYLSFRTHLMRHTDPGIATGWETTDFPSVCENCLPDNPYVQMLKQDHGLECKLCTRPFTVFTWKADRTSRTKRTNICLTCARLKNCCQCCMLDLSFGLPITVRDAALKMIAPGPTSDVNREYYAQENEREIEEGRGGLEEYDKTDQKARELLQRLANSEPYHKRQRRLEANKDDQDGSAGGDGSGAKQITGPSSAPGPIRNIDSRSTRGDGRGGRGGRSGRPFPSTSQLPPQPQDILPPRDPKVTSLFVTGVEDDLPEHAIRTFFAPFGTLRSIVCSHRSHCAFINYATREGAEEAAEHCQGKAIIQGCPLRVQWGRPKPLDHLDTEERMAYARSGRETAKAIKQAANPAPAMTGDGSRAIQEKEVNDLATIAPPPGQEDSVHYSSLTGD